MESTDEARDAGSVRKRGQARRRAVPVPAGQPGIGAGDVPGARAAAAGPPAGQGGAAPAVARAPGRAVAQGARAARVPARATALADRKSKRQTSSHKCAARMSSSDLIKDTEIQVKTPEYIHVTFSKP